MARLVTIEVVGTSGNYEAMVRRISEQNNKLYAGVQQGAAQAVTSVRAFETSLAGVNKLLGQLGIGLSVFQGVNLLNTFTAWAEGMNAVSKRTKIAVEDLNALERIVKQEEGSFEDFTNGLRFLSKAISAANDPTSEQAKLFKQLNIDISGGLMPTMLQLADRMKYNLSTTDQMGVSLKLLGKASENMVNFMTQGSDAILRRIKEEKDAGVITADFANRVDEARDSWTHFKDVVSVKIGQPVVESILDIIAALIKLDNQLGISQGIKKQFEAGNPVTPYLQSLMNSPAMRMLLGKPIYGTGTVQDPWADLDAKAKEWEATTAGLAGKIKINTGSDAAAAKALELLNKQQEALAKLTTEQLQAAQAAAILAREQNNITRIGQDLDAEVKATTYALIEQETAAKLAAAAHDKLGPAVMKAIKAEGDRKKALFDSTERQRAMNKYIEQAKADLVVYNEMVATQAEAWTFVAPNIAKATDRTREQIDAQYELMGLQADYLEITGKTQNAEAARFQATIVYLEQIKKITDDPEKIKVIDQRIINAQTSLGKLGQISVNIGQHVGNTLNDIFTALITGTLKSVDIGKAALATLGRIVTDAFSQIMQKKLSFELDLFSNMRNLPGQAQNAVTSGGGFGGILNMILYGTGGNPAGVEGPLQENGTFGGGGLSGIFGGLLQGIGRMFGLGGQGGFGGGGIMGDIGSIIRGASGGGGGGGAGGIIGGIFGGIGNVWTMISNTQLGTQISAWVATAVASISETVSTIASTVSNAVTSVLESISWIPYIGWVIAAITMIYRIIANQQERPNVKLSGEFGGVAFDPATQQFIPGEINVGIGRKVGIKNSQAGALATNLQQRLIILSNQWTDILNVFPDFLAKDIIPALDETNERLRYNFANLKFSPGGSRNLQQEIEAMSGPNGLVRMLNAFLPALSAGFTGALGAAGIPSAGTIATGFRNLEPKPYWEFPKEDWDKFIQALKDTATLTGSLASTGASKFLAPADLAAMGSIFDALFAQTDVKTFTEMAAKLQEQLKPVTDFLTSSVQTATDLFGRGLTAAMEAATESDARLNFLNSLNTGIKDVVFQGLSDAFIASAQFNDLLAPIQQQIRIFATQALTTGETPDIGAFRSAILPAIQAISTRADLLGPLIDALQSLGLNIRELLGLVPEVPAETPATPAATAKGTTQVTINVSGAGDPAEVAREIEKILRATVPPT